MTSTLKTTLILTIAAAVVTGSAIYAASGSDVPAPSTDSAAAFVETQKLVPLQPAAAPAKSTSNNIASLDATKTDVPKRAKVAERTEVAEREIAQSHASALRSATISVARLHNGRFLPTPHQEARAWSDLEIGNTAFTPLPASAHFDVLPLIAQDGVDSDNKIDEIRLAAIDAKSDYVLIYATGKGAFWGEFGGKPLEYTGLTVGPASPAHENGDAKAVLVQAHNGHVLGAVTTWAPDMQTLTAEVKSMIEQL